MRYGTLAFGTHQLFRVVLGLEVRMIEILGFGEHVFAEHAGIQSGHRDRTHVMEAAGFELLGQLNGVARSANVRRNLTLCVGGKIVDRCKVEKMPDLAGQRLALGRTHSERRLGQISVNGDQPFAVRTETRLQRLELVLRSLAHQAVHVAVACQEPCQQVPSDEARRARHEIRHVAPPGCCDQFNTGGMIPRRFAGCDVGAAKAGCLGKPATHSAGLLGTTPAFEKITCGASSVCRHLIVAPARQTASLPSPSRLDLPADRAGDACVELITASPFFGRGRSSAMPLR